MGSLAGHVAPGLGFFLIGFWHLLNHIKLHIHHPNSYRALPWFPTSRCRYLEFFIIIGGSLANISVELFIGPSKHHPFDTEGYIPSNHLRNFEHTNISLNFLVYAIFCIILDKTQAPARSGLTLMLGAIAFGQEFLVFHFHSTDHMGLEGHYHWLLQIVISVSFITALLGIGYSKSFLISLARSVSILFQGVWIMVMGIMLWTPEFLPKGCFLNVEEGQNVVRCHNHKALERAKSLVNISFSWYIVGVTIFVMSIYFALMKMLQEKVGYERLNLSDVQEKEEEDVEAQKRNLLDQKQTSFLPVGKSFSCIEIER